MAENPETHVTRAELAAAVRQFTRRSLVLLFLGAAGVIPVMWGISALIDMMVPYGFPRDPVWRIPAFFLALVPLFGVAGMTDWLMQRTKLTCASCQTRLVKHSSLVLVTGRCPECAQPVFADREAAVEPQTESFDSDLASQADIADAGAAAHRKAVRAALTWALSGAALIGVAAAANAAMRPVVETVLGEVWTPFLWPVLLAPGLVGLFWACVIYERRTSQSGRSCPRCGDELSRYAEQTGNCSSCGQRAVSDPFPGMEPSRDGVWSSGRGWTVAEFRAISSGREDRLVKVFLVPIGVGMIGVILCRLFEGSPAVSIYSWVALPPAVIWFGWFIHKEQRRLQCPECGKELLQMHSLVVSSRRCYHCGSVVLRDGDATVEQAAVG